MRGDLGRDFALPNAAETQFMIESNALGARTFVLTVKFIFVSNECVSSISSNIINSCAAERAPARGRCLSALAVEEVVHCVSFNLLLNKMISTFRNERNNINTLDAALRLRLSLCFGYFSGFESKSIFIELANGQGAKGNGARACAPNNEKFNSRFQTFVCCGPEFASFDSRDLFCSPNARTDSGLPFILFIFSIFYRKLNEMSPESHYENVLAAMTIDCVPVYRISLYEYSLFV